ncbi:MAG: hypothetical protein ACOZNI_23450 [Myxococcota bacterium]
MRIWSCALPSPPPPSPRVLRVCEAIWARMSADRAHAGPILSRALREARTLGSKERPLAGDLLTGLVRHERALARLDPDPIRAWLRLASDGPPDLDDPDDAYAIALSLPDDLAREWWDRLGPERAVALARLLAGRAPVTLRVLRDPVDLPVPHRREGRAIVLEGRANVHLLDAWKEGRVEVQDLHSQRIVDVAFPGAGARVLDLCAGAGGKSLALAAMGARVQAWDVRPRALDELRKRAARAGLAVEIGPPKGTYDTVLVDAPCSGSGVLRRHPENRWKLRYMSDTQNVLMIQARRIAGRVVYSTCSLATRENEAIVPGGETIWPTEEGEGFYVAVSDS